ncbi:hypothetical protein HGM15179_006610 [Zosterops borbonicus]|uniref:Uncharacterized protein n=1 Tax=Zosterops borbonicus TaxID=364589 RepID=A0A8K1LNV1_9PASS|nr:hypothetical protein HGM15179_006610 [Zosterops borbonicus]
MKSLETVGDNPSNFPALGFCFCSFLLHIFGALEKQCLASPLATLCHLSCYRETGGGGRSWLRVVPVWFEDSLSIAGGEEEEEERKEGEEKKEDGATVE